MRTSTPEPTGRASVQRGAAVVGAVFLLIGVLGFVPGVTTRYSTMMFASHLSGAELFGLFQVSVLHNLLHLGFGIAGLLLARTALRARNYLLYGGLAYLALFLYGIVVEYESRANVVPFNDADNVLHLALAAAMVSMSFLLDPGKNWRRTVQEGRAVV